MAEPAPLRALVHLASGITSDLFQRGDAPFDRQELSRARAEVVAIEPDRSVVVESAEDTILRKLHWYRLGGERSDRQWSDQLEGSLFGGRLTWPPRASPRRSARTPSFQVVQARLVAPYTFVVDPMPAPTRARRRHLNMRSDG